MSSTDHPLDDLAAYAIDALDDTERAAVADHLSQCLDCQDDLAVHYETLAALSPEEAPPPAVWHRVAASIGTPALPDPHATTRPTPPRARTGNGPATAGFSASGAAEGQASAAEDDVVRVLSSPGRAGTFRLGLLAAAACLAIALAVGGAVGFALGSSGDDDADISVLAEQASDELATLSSPEGEPVARVVADEDGAYLVLDGLENLPEGRAYQLWSLTESEPVSLGMLGRDGTNTVAFRLPPTITELAISEAPTSGDAAPDGEFRASGTITRT